MWELRNSKLYIFPSGTFLSHKGLGQFTAFTRGGRCIENRIACFCDFVIFFFLLHILPVN